MKDVKAYVLVFGVGTVVSLIASTIVNDFFSSFASGINFVSAGAMATGFIATAAYAIYRMLHEKYSWAR
jgi:sulfite exporter TauE/SafE